TGTDPINLLATAGIHAPARSADPAAPFTGSPTPTPNLHGDHFDDELGARMSWLADQKIGHAHIKLSPADLGPVEVRLHLNGDQVNASFSSAQPEVRQALENSLPRLREMLGQHGFQLGQADVGQQQQQASQNARQGGGSNGGNAGGGTGDELLGSVGIPSVVLRQRGLLDAYA
ncbi:flagellar hook-length control protein FliK, partial [Xanthomonas translucens]